MNPMDRMKSFPIDAIRKVRAIYNSHLSLEVRDELADWIDDQQWFEEAAGETKSINNAAKLQKAFIEKLDSRSCSASVSPHMKLLCFETIQRIKEAFWQEPLDFVLFMQNCLRREKALIEELEPPSIVVANHDMIMIEEHEILPVIEELPTPSVAEADQCAVVEAPELEAARFQKIENNTDLLQTQMQQFEDCHKNLCSLIRQNETVSPQTSHDEIEQKRRLEAVIAQQGQAIIQLRLDLLAAIWNNLIEIGVVEEVVIGEIERWKDDQKKEGFGNISGLNLDQVQVSVELLFKVIWQMREIVKQISELSSQTNFDDELARCHIGAINIQNEINRLITRLLQKSFMVEKQPVRVINIKARLHCNLRLLFLSLSIGKMKVSIINEHMAANLYYNNDVKVIGNSSSGLIEYHKEPEFVLDVEGRKLRAVFNSLKVSIIKREKRGYSHVTSEKFCFLFQTQVNLFGQLFPVYTTSLPVVVISNTMSEPAAKATIVWDDAFSETGRVPFRVPQNAQWRNIASVLNKIFIQVTSGGTEIENSRGLCADSMLYLAKKAFRGRISANYDDEMLGFEDFQKTSLQEAKFNFWEWFYASSKVIRDFAMTEWQENKIYGFIGMEEAKQILLPCKRGTFLLRFSDSVLGGLSVAWRDESGVVFIAPFIAPNLRTISLSKRILGLNQLSILYPDIAKDVAFKNNQEGSSGSLISKHTPFNDTCTSKFEPETHDTLAYHKLNSSYQPWDTREISSTNPFVLHEDAMNVLTGCDKFLARELLILEESIGNGNFGYVHKGRLQLPEHKSKMVAVKTLMTDNKDVSRKEMNAFVKEAMVMKDFDHPNVLELLGVAFNVQDGSPLVVLPFMQNGDLLNYVRNFDNILEKKDLLRFGVEIAFGMEYLASQRFVHRDLAARNCMLDHNLQVKVADFGLSRDIYEQEYYRSGDNKAELPIKWMAPESIERGIYDEKTDVWSFGVTLWELLTRGFTPYPGVSNSEVIAFLTSHKRLSQPAFCPAVVYRIMQRCWASNPNERPSFVALVEEIKTCIKEMQEAL